MPRGDGTGPDGRGPMTGRGLGYCAGNDRPGFMEPGSRRGSGRGRGFFGRARGRFGFGFGRRYPPKEPSNGSTRSDQKEQLEEEKKAVEEELEEINRRLKDM